MLLAVNMPEHEPQVGQPVVLDGQQFFCAQLAVLLGRGRNEHVDQVDRLAVRRLAGLHRAAADENRGDIAAASRPSACRGRSCRSWECRSCRRTRGRGSSSRPQSAISSRLGSEYFIPSWPMAMPSSTPIVLKMNGTPPASRTHCLTYWPTLSRWTWPGMMSTWLLQTAINGLRKSSSPSPVARSRLRWGARASPSLTMSERMAGSPLRKQECDFRHSMGLTTEIVAGDVRPFGNVGCWVARSSLWWVARPRAQRRAWLSRHHARHSALGVPPTHVSAISDSASGSHVRSMLSYASMPPKFIYFDLGKVLVDFSVERMLQQVAAVADITADAARAALFDGQLVKQHESGQLSCDALYESFCQATATRPDRDRLTTAVSDIFALNVAVLPLVAQLGGAGCRLGILSNTSPMHWTHCLRHYRMLEEIFPVHALSFRVGAEAGSRYLSRGSRTCRRAAGRHLLRRRPGRARRRRTRSGLRRRPIHRRGSVGRRASPARRPFQLLASGVPRAVAGQ